MGYGVVMPQRLDCSLNTSDVTPRVAVSLHQEDDRTCRSFGVTVTAGVE